MERGGIRPIKYSWKFDRDLVCTKLFSNKNVRIIKGEGKYTECTLDDFFIPRMCGRGFSDQVDVPQGMHEVAFHKVLEEARTMYGEHFGQETYRGYSGNDIRMTLYIK